jgi:hypothetical protein
VAASPADRIDAMLAPAVEVPASLGARNAALLGLRARLFGRAQSLRCSCVHCGGTNEFSVDCEALARELAPGPGAADVHVLESSGHVVEFRVPAVDDVHAAAIANDDAGFANMLMARCITRCTDAQGNPCAPTELPPEVGEAISRSMETLEPGATVGFDVVCAECGSRWTAPMDCGEVLWSEIQSRAERILLDIDMLARAYGWTEPQVLALSDVRRAAYLQLAGSA